MTATLTAKTNDRANTAANTTTNGDAEFLAWKAEVDASLKLLRGGSFGMDRLANIPAGGDPSMRAKALAQVWRELGFVQVAADERHPSRAWDNTVAFFHTQAASAVNAFLSSLQASLAIALPAAVAEAPAATPFISTTLLPWKTTTFLLHGRTAHSLTVAFMAFTDLPTTHPIRARLAVEDCYRGSGGKPLIILAVDPPVLSVDRHSGEPKRGPLPLMTVAEIVQTTFTFSAQYGSGYLPLG